MNFTSMLLGEKPSLPSGRTLTYKLLKADEAKPRAKYYENRLEKMRLLVLDALKNGCDEYATIQTHTGLSNQSVRRQIDHFIETGRVHKNKCNLPNGHFKWRFTLL